MAKMGGGGLIIRLWGSSLEGEVEEADAGPTKAEAEETDANVNVVSKAAALRFIGWEIAGGGAAFAAKS